MITEAQTGAFGTYEVHNAGTRYIAHVMASGNRKIIAVVTRWSGNCGEWIALPLDEDEIAWSYLAEKIPGIEQHGGDRPGFVKLFAEFGIRIFGWEIDSEEDE